MPEKKFDDCDSILIVGVPVAIVATVGSMIGAIGVIQQGFGNGDTTLNLAARRAKPCEAFDVVGTKLDDQSEAQAIVDEYRTTDAVCYAGSTASGLTWYSTGGH